MSKKTDDTDLVKRASRNWLKAQIAGKSPSLWVHNMQLEWLATGQLEPMCQFILDLCENVDPDDDETIGMIGADPMLALYLWVPDRALQAIEEIADQHPVVLDALHTISVGKRQAGIEALLARHGRSVE